MKKYLLIIGLIMTCQVVQAPAQNEFPIADFLGRWITKTTATVQTAIKFIHTTTAPLVAVFRNVQNFFHKAKTIVNGVVRNMRMIEDIVQVQGEIRTLFNNTINILNSPRDINGDGEDDFALLDKWKHIQILLAISAEATASFELFTNIVEEGATTMDDKGRIQFVQQTLKDLRKIRSSMRIQIKRINREMYQYARLNREFGLYNALFSEVE